MGMTDAEKARIKMEIFEFLDNNGDMIRNDVVKRLNPACSASKVDSDLKAWRIANGIQTRKSKPMKSDNVTVDSVRISERMEIPGVPVDNKPVPQVKKLVVDAEMHSFSCSVKIPLETYKRFKLASAYRGDKIRELLARGMDEYVREDPAVLKAVSALDD